MLNRDQYIEQMKKQLDDLNQQIGKFETKSKEVGAELHAKYDEQMIELRKHSSTAQEKMEEIKVAGEDRWEAMVAEGEKVQKAFMHSLNYFKSQMK
jgi:phage shock protein A